MRSSFLLFVFCLLFIGCCKEELIIREVPVIEEVVVRDTIVIDEPSFVLLEFREVYRGISYMDSIHSGLYIGKNIVVRDNHQYNNIKLQIDPYVPYNAYIPEFPYYMLVMSFSDVRDYYYRTVEIQEYDSFINIVQVKEYHNIPTDSVFIPLVMIDFPYRNKQIVRTEL